MSAYVFGELFGRLALSYLVVLLVLLLVNQFKGKLSLSKSTKWYSIAATVLIFVLGIGASVSQSVAV